MFFLTVDFWLKDRFRRLYMKIVEFFATKNITKQLRSYHKPSLTNSTNVPTSNIFKASFTCGAVAIQRRTVQGWNRIWSINSTYTIVAAQTIRSCWSSMQFPTIPSCIAIFTLRCFMKLLGVAIGSTRTWFPVKTRTIWTIITFRTLVVAGFGISCCYVFRNAIETFRTYLASCWGSGVGEIASWTIYWTFAS